MTNRTPRIYVVCTAAFWSGIDHGVWIDADKSVDHIRAQVSAMLKALPIDTVDEWAIHDSEGFEAFNLNSRLVQLQHDLSLERRVVGVAEFIAEYGRLGSLIVDGFINDLALAREMIEYFYEGKWDSLAGFAAWLSDELGDLDGVPDHIIDCIDFEAMGHVLINNGGWFEIEDGDKVHVFATR